MGFMTRRFIAHSPKAGRSGAPRPPADKAPPSKAESSKAPPSKARPSPAAVREIGGPKGPEPTRYGDWEHDGLCTDF